MEIKTFDNSYLQEVKNVLKDVFFNEYSKENYNEWEFAESVLKTNGYIPELCLIALEENQVIGYNALTIAKIGETEGLALGPLGVKQTYQNKGIGTCLVEESIRRAKRQGILGLFYLAEIIIPDLVLKRDRIFILWCRIMLLKMRIFKSYF